MSVVEAYASENNREWLQCGLPEQRKKMLQDLSIQFNRARQAAITQERNLGLSAAQSPERKEDKDE